jgi:uncharacterized protein YndB with AHSA1/START domain
MSALLPVPVEDTKTLVITRTLSAPRALAWKMFTDPYHFAQWWGPKGYTNRVDTFDLKPGGRWQQVMIAPDGRELPTDSIFIDVTPPERLVYRNAAADPKIFGANPPPAFTRTLSLEETPDGKTRLMLVCVFDTAEHRERIAARGFREGTNEGFDKLEAYIATT